MPRLRRVYEVSAVGLSKQAQAVQADVVVELHIDECDSVPLFLLLERMAVQNFQFDLLTAHEGAPADGCRQGVGVDMFDYLSRNHGVESSIPYDHVRLCDF